MAVIDTGIDGTHPNLAPNVVNGINTITDSAYLNNHNGTPSTDCSVGRTSTSAADDNGHGTHVAGTIGAKNDGTGVVGVAPGATLYAVKVLNSQGSGYGSDIICGIDWVTNNAKNADGTQKIHAANMSLGGTGSDDNKTCIEEIAAPTDAYKKAICGSVRNSGVTYVVSAGNDGGDLAKKVPAAYRDGTNPLVLTVTAMSDSDGLPGGTGGAPSCRTGEKDDYPATFSNYATTAVDENHTIPAPGVCIKSTWKGGVYNTISGTSMASPHITGTVALCLRSGGSCYSGTPSSPMTPGQIIDKLRADAKTKDTNDGSYGFQGDPTSSPTSGRYYGYLEYAGDYRSSSGPDTAINSGPSGTVNSTSATFTYSSSDPSATFECSLDGAAFSGCPGAGQSYSGLSEGQHHFEVRATNSSGTDSTPASRDWTVDTTAPTISSVDPLDGATDVAPNTNVTATFSEDVDSSTLSSSTFTLAPVDSSGNVGQPITATVTYDSATKKATLDPSADLNLGTKYTATVTTDVKDKAGNSLVSAKVWSFTTAQIVAPSGLQATRSGNVNRQSINLTWTDNSSNEDNFTVERCTGSSSYCAIDSNWKVLTSTLAANTTSYADKSVSRGTTYWYRVKATKGTLSSGYSNVASATTK